MTSRPERRALDHGHQQGPQPDLEDLHARVARHGRRRSRGSLALGLAVTVLLVAGLWATAADRQAGNRQERTSGPASEDVFISGSIPSGGWLLNLGSDALYATSDGVSMVLDGLRPSDTSPDGATVVGTSTKRIVYGEQDDPYAPSVTQNPALIAVDVRSGSRRVLAEAPPNGSIVGPLWSPDGSMVAYRLALWAVDPQTEHPAGRVDAETVCVAFVDGHAPRCFASIDSALSLDWHPTGQSLVVGLSRGPAIEKVDVVTGETEVIIPRGGSTSVRQALAERGWHRIYAILAPEWSPTGEYLSVHAETSGGSVPLVVDSSGDFVAAGKANADSQDLAWSPTGSVLAYTMGLQIAPEGSKDDFSVRLLTPADLLDASLVEFTTRSAFIANIVWSPDGSLLAVGGSDGVTDVITLVDLTDGGVITRIQVEAEVADSLADWAPAAK